MSIYDYPVSRAVVIERPYEVSLREIELTDPLEDAYICRTRFSAISTGTDMKTYRGQQHPEQCWYPLVPGYETAGDVVAVGPSSKAGLAVGDRVMINESRVYKNVCSAWGGGTEYTVKDSRTADSAFDYSVKLPDNVSYEDGVLAYLPCVSLKGVYRIQFMPGDYVVVVGAGMIAISAMQCVKILHPDTTVICIERNAFRRSIAEKFADYVIPVENSAEQVKKITNGHMADVIIEGSGNPEVPGTLHQYAKNTGWNLGDRPTHIHLQGDYPEKIVLDHWHRWFGKHCTLTMSCALAAGCKEQILQWISEGKFDVKSLPVEIWPVSECAEAFKYVQSKGADVFKVLLDWSK